MNIIISPAKQMKRVEDDYVEMTTPLFLEKSKILVSKIQEMDYEELKSVLKCSDKLARKAFDQYQSFDFSYNPSPAILTYTGIQYQYMEPSVFSYEQIHYVQSHVRILSGLYGLLKPLDGIVPYRLEMQTKLKPSLYEYWSDTLANTLEEKIILNLASEEYAKCIRKYRPIIDVSFCEEENGKLKEKGVYAKMARGSMVRYLASQQVDTLEEVKLFSDLHYSFSKEHSTENHLVFLKKEDV